MLLEGVCDVIVAAGIGDGIERLSKSSMRRSPPPVDGLAEGRVGGAMDVLESSSPAFLLALKMQHLIVNII